MFEWDDFLALADELARRPGDEAAARSAISRAYYATFHAARHFLRQADVPIDSSGRAHRQVRVVLFSWDEDVARDLVRLHHWRKEADYDNPCSFDAGERALDVVDLARKNIDKIRLLP